MQAGVEDQPAEFRRESHGALLRYFATCPRPINADETREPAQSALSGYRTPGYDRRYMRFSASLAALFALLIWKFPLRPIRCVHTGAIYIAHAATGQEPLSPESGLAPGSIAEINLRVSRRISDRRVALRFASRRRARTNARDLVDSEFAEVARRNRDFVSGSDPRRCCARAGGVDRYDRLERYVHGSSPYFGDQFRCVPRRQVWIHAGQDQSLFHQSCGEGRISDSLGDRAGTALAVFRARC